MVITQKTIFSLVILCYNYNNVLAGISISRNPLCILQYNMCIDLNSLLVDLLTGGFVVLLL